MNSLLTRLEAYPSTRRLVAAVLEAMPDHLGYLEKSFDNRALSTTEITEKTASLIELMENGRFDGLVEGYRWLCEMIQEEELFFRRTGSYRNGSFAEVNAAVYQDRERMSGYMDGLLATEVLWIQHARSMDFYVNSYLPKLGGGYRHLEIGPGHGLLLHHVAMDPRCGEIRAWDISPASLARTEQCLSAMKPVNPVRLELCDIMAPPECPVRWDSIVLSEILEHLEDPFGAMRNLSGCLAPHGRVYVNVPVNAPTIDHIHLFRSPEDAVALVEKAGFVVDEMLLSPGAGYNLTKSRKREASISVALIARANA